jgi:hypothetical protein
MKNSVYIFGWGNMNLRWDPCDRVLYQAGWDTVPNIGAPAGDAGPSTLIIGSVYRYRAAWIDLLTGEEGELGAEQTFTPTAALPTAFFDNITGTGADFGPYGGLRHFYYHNAMPGGAELSNADVGLVIYRTEADEQIFNFLTLIRPDGTPSPPVNVLGAGLGDGLINCTLEDDGLATDPSRQADVINYQDQIFGVSWRLGTDATNVADPARLYYNDFRTENSFIERFDVRDSRNLPLTEGEIITAVAKTNRSMVVFSNSAAYEVDAVPNATLGTIQLSVRPLEWTVGCVGPKAWTYVSGYLYWLSDRGPYRWTPGLPEPEWIGKNMIPMFIDPETGLCQLNMAGKLESEVLYDQDADAVRFIFPCGTTPTPNRHLSYYVKAGEMGDVTGGWSFHSPAAQALDYSGVYTGLIGGTPVTPFDRKERLIFSDAEGFLYEYDPDLTRGGLPNGVPATGVIQAASTNVLIITTGGLYVNGDDMEGLRLEVVHTDGTIDVRTVLSNTAVNIVPDAPLSVAAPEGATWYVGGIPAYWRSWVDSAGDPSSHKSLKHLYCGYNREFVGGAAAIDISVSSSNDWPAVVSSARTASLTVHRAKIPIFISGRYFTYEFANSFPDQPFMISYFEPMLRKQGRRRL